MSTRVPVETWGAGVQSQSLFFFLLLAVSLFTATDLAARSKNLVRWEMQRSSDLSARNGKLFSNTGNFIDYEERILLDEIPATDPSVGGVYFFGTSNMKWAFTTWDLPPRLQARLHNYGMGASTHETALRLIRYLTDKGALNARTKTEVVIGVSFHLGATETPTSYFPALVRRQGLYKITADDRLVDAQVSAAERSWRIEKARSGGLVRNLFRLLNNALLARFNLSHQPKHDPATYQEQWRSYMGPDWRRNINREIGYLHDTITLLHSKNIPVKVIFLPQATWMDSLPFPPFYAARVRAICNETSTPVVDWSKALPNEDFVDSNHLTVAGQTRFRKMILSDDAAYL